MQQTRSWEPGAPSTHRSVRTRYTRHAPVTRIIDNGTSTAMPPCGLAEEELSGESLQVETWKIEPQKSLQIETLQTRFPSTLHRTTKEAIEATSSSESAVATSAKSHRNNEDKIATIAGTK